MVNNLQSGVQKSKKIALNIIDEIKRIFHKYCDIVDCEIMIDQATSKKKFNIFNRKTSWIWNSQSCKIS